MARQTKATQSHDVVAAFRKLCGDYSITDSYKHIGHSGLVFDCKLYRGDQFLGYAENNGRGGPTMFRFIVADELERLRKHAKEVLTKEDAAFEAEDTWLARVLDTCDFLRTLRKHAARGEFVYAPIKNFDEYGMVFDGVHCAKRKPGSKDLKDMICLNPFLI